MKTLNPYLQFDGDCAEAMKFYQENLGSALTLQTVGESPLAAQMPQAKDKVMHAEMKINGTTLFYASDMMDAGKANPGNTIALCLNCSSEKEITDLFTKLSAGGKVLYPLKKEFWGDTFGQFVDKFGVRWMMNFSEPKS